MLLGFLLIWLIVLLLHFHLKMKGTLELIKEIPRPPKTYPIIGNALLFVGNPEEIKRKFLKLYLKFGKILAIWIGPWLHIFIYNSKDVEVVLKTNKTVDKSFHYEFLRPWLGDSILISSGTKFRQNKKILMQSFQTNNLKQYLIVFNEQAQDLVERLKSKIGDKEFDIHSELSLCTMYSLLETSMGVDKETLGKEAIDYAKAVVNVGRLTHLRVCSVWLYPEILFRFSKLRREQDKHLNILNNLTNRVIFQRKREFELRKQQNKTKDDKQWTIFVDNFFDSKNENELVFKEEEIKDEVMTMLFAGQDTTTVSLGFALSLLGIYQDQQEKVVEELKEIFGNSNRSVTNEDVNKMKYLEQVIQETWRLFPPIPIIAKCPKEDIPLEDYTLPKNSTIVIPIILVHRNPEEYPHPHRFDPDNFLPEKIKARHPCSFIPFSTGTRTCIGPKYAMLVIKVILATLLRNFKVHSKYRMKDFYLATQTTLHRKEGFLISLENRNM